MKPESPLNSPAGNRSCIRPRLLPASCTASPSPAISPGGAATIRPESPSATGKEKFWRGRRRLSSSRPIPGRLMISSEFPSTMFPRRRVSASVRPGRAATLPPGRRPNRVRAYSPEKAGEPYRGKKRSSPLSI
ncbi:hypothetical protein SDC9_193340 [bioreactor metagenome]|uniref:Uncharacterized protein n=1 Tax=bioreactor metagenome TaxID=1076179 RepID=A0A645I5U3_9ZZZZ